MSDEILLSAAASVAKIHINRPQKKNALNAAMYRTMTGALEQYEADEAVRVVLVHGGADFSAGNDLRDFLNAGAIDLQDSPPLQFLRALHTFSKPVVMAVQGVAIGIGATMLLHADLVLAGRSASFAFPFVKLGLVPEGGATLLLPSVIGLARAKRYLMTGETFDAQTATEMGLVSGVLEDTDLLCVAQDHALTLAALPGGALRQTKQLLRAPLAHATNEQMSGEARAFATCLETDDFRTAAQRLLKP